MVSVIRVPPAKPNGAEAASTACRGRRCSVSRMALMAHDPPLRLAVPRSDGEEVRRLERIRRVVDFDGLDSDDLRWRLAPVAAAGAALDMKPGDTEVPVPVAARTASRQRRIGQRLEPQAGDVLQRRVERHDVRRQLRVRPRRQQRAVRPRGQRDAVGGVGCSSASAASRTPPPARSDCSHCSCASRSAGVGVFSSCSRRSISA